MPPKKRPSVVALKSVKATPIKKAAKKPSNSSRRGTPSSKASPAPPGEYLHELRFYPWDTPLPIRPKQGTNPETNKSDRQLQKDMLESIARSAITISDTQSTTITSSFTSSLTPLPNPQRATPLTTPFRTSDFHPKTGKIRRPRSASSLYSSSSSDTELSPLQLSQKWKKVPFGGWISTATSKYGFNKPKCPPCYRLKKKDPCRGPPPCRECFRKGRRTAEMCQEWGEGFVPRQKRDRFGRFISGKV
ncbi:hypothetical protein B0O99DRAFT_685284 [Bisporella sp. PMI_857]|nr:hypothetical protein B0O99DRAFT_685284 [Bisporella sp. PMI_857]